MLFLRKGIGNPRAPSYGRSLAVRNWWRSGRAQFTFIARRLLSPWSAEIPAALESLDLRQGLDPEGNAMIDAGNPDAGSFAENAKQAWRTHLTSMNAVQTGTYLTAFLGNAAARAEVWSRASGVQHTRGFASAPLRGVKLRWSTDRKEGLRSRGLSREELKLILHLAHYPYRPKYLNSIIFPMNFS